MVLHDWLGARYVRVAELLGWDHLAVARAVVFMRRGLSTRPGTRAEIERRLADLQARHP